jgi:GntR family carbon starvation induced transcriptional regulator
LHRVFHVALLAGCGLRWLMDFNDLLFDCAERYRNLLAIMGTRGTCTASIGRLPRL